MKIKNVKMIDVSDWDKLVGWGTFNLTIPSVSEDEYMYDSIPEQINGTKMGVKFKKWLDRDPKQPVGSEKENWGELVYFGIETFILTFMQSQMIYIKRA